MAQNVQEKGTHPLYSWNKKETYPNKMYKKQPLLGTHLINKIY